MFESKTISAAVTLALLALAQQHRMRPTTVAVAESAAFACRRRGLASARFSRTETSLTQISTAFAETDAPAHVA